LKNYHNKKGVVVMSSARKKIVIIDDFDFFLISLRTQLEEKFDIYTAQNFESFKMLLDNVKPDLAILDIEMPGFDGFDVFRMVKDKHSDIPVLYLSYLDDKDTVKKAMELGADDFAHKSISRTNLIKRIENLLYPKAEKIMPIILAVDEDAYVLYSVCTLLKESCKVYALSNPGDTHDFLSKTTPDLLILDYELFKTPYANIVRGLISHAVSFEVPFIFLTSEDASENLSREYITIKKPFDKKLLQDEIDACLQGYKTRRILRSISK
jgi:DNA-binding response OmpR family regulator